MLGRRKHFRVKANTKVSWSIERGPSGVAEVLEFSISGIQLVLDMSFEIADDCIIYIEGKAGGRLAGIKKVRLRWHKKVLYLGQHCLQCGGDFI